MAYIGIDPGVSGGIAVLRSDGRVLEVRKMPDTPADIVALLGRYGLLGLAVLEKVSGGGSFIGGRRAGAAGMFTFGRSYGWIEGILPAVKIPYDQAIPRKWQQVMGVSYPAGASQTEKKNISKARAQQLFPTLTVTHAIADALLLAEYCRRLHRSDRREAVIHGKENEQGEGDAGAQAGTGSGTAQAWAEVDERLRESEGRQGGGRKESAGYRTAKERGATLAVAPGDGAGARRSARRHLRVDR